MSVDRLNDVWRAYQGAKDIDGRMDVDGELTPLMVATGLGNHCAADTLIELGADKTLKSQPSFTHEGGLTASDLADKLGSDGGIPW